MNNVNINNINNSGQYSLEIRIRNDERTNGCYTYLEEIGNDEPHFSLHNQDLHFKINNQIKFMHNNIHLNTLSSLNQFGTLIPFHLINIDEDLFLYDPYTSSLNKDRFNSSVLCYILIDENLYKYLKNGGKGNFFAFWPKYGKQQLTILDNNNYPKLIRVIRLNNGNTILVYQFGGFRINNIANINNVNISCSNIYRYITDIKPMIKFQIPISHITCL